MALTIHDMFIDGAWASASDGGTYDVTNPATGEVICEVPEGDHIDVDKAVHAARRRS